jgi:hypothetical protein
VLSLQFARQLLQSIPASRKQREIEPIGSQHAREFQADAARCAGDQGILAVIIRGSSSRHPFLVVKRCMFFPGKRSGLFKALSVRSESPLTRRA